MGWLRQSLLIIGVSVIRRLMLCQEPRKGAGFLQGSARNSTPTPPHHHSLCITVLPGGQAPISSLQPCDLEASRKEQQMTSAGLQSSRGTSQTCDHHGSKPLETFVLDQKPRSCHHRALSALFQQ